ncbi:hypothetical protein EGW08_021863 [Elysia chlorotica]|uniref:G-protein coupled receptors family 1 profile domain-containing protein n=1 Tax=Elysia chlorotica TaxID=188477 RepID=A0A433SMG4_ELYCH|nr:hypothetical protein EGW08_021863 [Elysia chlorotica]
METNCSNSSEIAGLCVAEKPVIPPFEKELAIGLKVLAPLWPVIITFGLCSNITNIIVFLQAGVKENVTTLLLSLSLSDLTFLVLITPSMCGFFIKAYPENHSWPFDYKFSWYLLYWPAFTAYDLSAFISVSLGVMRCACVAMPLKFKIVFTKSRTIKWVLFLVVLAVALRVPVLTIFRIQFRKHVNPPNNSSNLIPFLAMVNRDPMSRINDVMNRGFVIWFNYSTMITCVCVLTLKLRQAYKIRRFCTAGSLPHSNATGEKTLKTDGRRLQSKDLQVIKSVVLVCTIFILSQLPFLVISTSRFNTVSTTTDNTGFVMSMTITGDIITTFRLGVSDPHWLLVSKLEIR